MIQTTEQLQQSARELALTHDVRRPQLDKGKQRLTLERQLSKLVALAADLDSEGATCSQPAAEWLLDHAEFIEEQGYTIRKELQNGALRRLPIIRKSGKTRIEEICGSFLSAMEGGFDASAFITYMDAYQEVSVLTIAEIWTMPLALRLKIINRLGDLFADVKERHEACHEVEKIVKPMFGNSTSPTAGELIAALDQAGHRLPLTGAVFVYLIGYLREWDDDIATVREWLAGRLEEGEESLRRLMAYEHRLQASYQMEAGRLIGSLRDIERTDWDPLLESMGLVEQTLLTEKAGSYPLLDSTSRITLRGSIAKLSSRLGVPENLVAMRAVHLADLVVEPLAEPSTDPATITVGERQTDHANHTDAPASGVLPRKAFAAYYLLEAEGKKELYASLKEFASPRPYPENGLLRRRSPVYFSILAALFAVFTVILIAVAGTGEHLTTFGWVLLSLLFILPGSELAVSVLHALIGKVMPSRPLLRYDFASGIPEGAETMVVIPVIWSKAEEVHDAAERLELHYLANRDPRLHFALLGDFADATSETAESDKKIFAAARERIEKLNEQYAAEDRNTFHLFMRKRVWSEAESVWMGWERKRGKLVEFVQLLSGKKDTGFVHTLSEHDVLHKIRYVITLDADTQLPIGSAQRMVGSIHLPFNRPRLNQSGTRVAEGYAVLQPRIAISRESADKSRLAALWAGNPGIDPYAFAVSDPYQDGFGQGIFTGKGIFDVTVFDQLLTSRIPDNLVLSHDLLEGGFLRGGLLSDIELIDGHPLTYRSFQQRLHRWVRGDWQLLCWLRSKVNDCGGTPKPVDLTPLTRWQIVDNMRRSLLPPALYLLLLISVLFPPAAGWIMLGAVLLTLFLPVVRSMFPPGNWVRHPSMAVSSLIQSLSIVLTLPFQSVLMADAIIRTLYRLGISKRRLLEWVSSAEIDRREQGRKGAIMLGLSSGYALAVIYGAAAIVLAPTAYTYAALLLTALWLLSPLAIRYLNEPPTEQKISLLETEKQELTSLAAQIWAYYEDFATAEDNYLPPDNVQLEPNNGVAHRTSPTNIGLMLACAVTARDFGFITTDELLNKIEQTVGTIERMAKWSGHLYNWYDTRTLIPLHPLYVSTVDSGNFVAYLITVKEGLSEWLKKDYGTEWPASASRLLDRLELLITDTDFRPLYDDSSKLLTLGFNADMNRRESILYDLLASEARQASFLAIAFGQIPSSHWFRLGRGMTKIGRNLTLLSWSGTMFEYLMPALIMRTYRGTIWESTFRGVFKRQSAYAQRTGVPIGISESGYYAFDYDMNYQYRAFGVPGLGFQRGLERDLVIAPYAAIMALPLQVREGLDNLKRLEEMGARGQYGFYEAIDCTASRMPEGHRHMIVRSFMAHHQGMSLLTLGNLLLPTHMQERFHADKRVQAAELLLQERVPDGAAIIEAPILRSRAIESSLHSNGRPMREFTNPVTDTPEVCILANGSFSSVVTTAGGGYTRWGKNSLTRWREDSVTESYGSAIYIRNVKTEQLWSPTLYPAGEEAAVKGKVRFMTDRAEFSTTYQEVDSKLEITVSSEHNAELRRLILTNNSGAEMLLEITTYVEIALAPKTVDDAHPAFSKLFVQTELDETNECLLAYRRPRSPKDESLWAAHSLFVDTECIGPLEFDTDRSAFIGRGRTMASPLLSGARLTGAIGAVLDPAFILRRRVILPPGKTIHAWMVSSMASSRDEVQRITSEFRDARQIEHAFELAAAHSQIELRHQNLTAAEAEVFHTLAGRILFTPPLQQERKQAIELNHKGQTGLWPMGISGDLPIVSVTVRDMVDISFIRRMVSGHGYLRRKGISFDLVLLNRSDGGYQQELHDEIQRIIQLASSYPPFEVPGGIYPVTAQHLTEEDQLLLTAVSRVKLDADGPSLSVQLNRKTAAAGTKPARKRAASDRKTIPAPVPSGVAPSHADLELYNGWGGFASGGNEYQLLLQGNKHLPAPWSNVMANPHFGSLVTELGTGYTWWGNSREFKLTPWTNDPVLDPPGEVFYLFEEESDEVWSPTPSPAARSFPCQVTHGWGYSRFESDRMELHQTMTVYVPPEDAVKIVELRLRNDSDRVRTLSAAYYCNFVLGVSKDASNPYTVTEWDERTESILAHNTYQENFRDSTAFLLLTVEGNQKRQAVSWTTDRREFIGRHGSLERPEAFDRDGKLSGHVGTQHDACGALMTELRLEPQEECVLYAVLGASASRQEALKLATVYQNAARCKAAYKETASYWERTVGQLTVQTPDREFDLMVNGWLLYQALSCRIWARTAFYQAGGAFGFRDQLQDSLSLLHTTPEKTRAQLLLHASHQYEEGDVQHWWHEETHKGIRTLYTDDLLWLPYAAARYAVHTGDWGVFDEQAPYLHSDPLRDGEHERYEATVLSGNEGSLYEHCIRAIDKGLTYGEQGIPLMGIGDWNDGMNSVGDEGKGQSVWLGWFLCEVLKRFLVVCERRGDQMRMVHYGKAREKIAKAINEHAWDGQWYRRARTDEGEWLGSHNNSECRIDAIAQSWSVISGAAPSERAKAAMHSFDRELVDRDLSLARLLTPAFDRTDPSPGYIQGYPPGIRENGAQYTHGVIWSIVAWSILGDGDKAGELFHLLNPIHHTRSLGDVRKYVGEPYVMAADVYTTQLHPGRSGWTWYTGASGWMYQAAVEWILGIRKENDTLHITPCAPRAWKQFSLSYRFSQATYEITVLNPDGLTGEDSVSFYQVLREDGTEIQTSSHAEGINLVEGSGTYQVTVTLMQRPTSTPELDAQVFEERPTGMII